MFNCLTANDFQKNLENINKIDRVNAISKDRHGEKTIGRCHNTIISNLTLTCSKGSEGVDLISMKGDVITEHQFYEQ